MTTKEKLASGTAALNGLVAYRATLEEKLRAELQKVADTATESDLALVARLTAVTHELSTEIVAMTPPAAAKIFLEHNHHNRDFVVQTAEEYSRRIRDGEWKQNNATIGLYEDGNVEDGQHRMGAIGLSNETVTVIVVRGIKKDAITTIDDGRARHAADAAKLEGITNAREKQLVIKGATAYEVKNGHKSAALKSESMIADAIRKNDAVLDRAIVIATQSAVGITSPQLKGQQAPVLAYLLLSHGWPEDLVRKNLVHMQAGASSNDNDKEPRFQGMNYIAKVRLDRAKGEVVSGVKQMGVLIYSIVEAQKGTKAVQVATIKGIAKATVMPNPDFPEIETQEAAE